MLLNKIGYARSNIGEDTLNLQYKALDEIGCKSIYADNACLSSVQLPKLSEMINHLRYDQAVVVWRMDRLAPDLQKLTIVLEEIAHKGSCVISISEPDLGTHGPCGKAALLTLRAAVNYELELHHERSRQGLRVAKNNGTRLGRPLTLSMTEREEIFHAVQSKAITQAEASRQHNVDPSTISRIMTHFRRHQP